MRRSIVTLDGPPEGLRRVETGAVQIGDDWPGLFVRGDEAIILMSGIHTLLEQFSEPDDATVRLAFGRLRRLAEIIDQDVIIRRADA